MTLDWLAVLPLPPGLLPRSLPSPRRRHLHLPNPQSMNLFVQAPDYGRLTSMHFYAWKKGLKTGMYYLRTRPAADAIPFTIDPASSFSGTGKGDKGKGGGDGVFMAAAFAKEREILGDVCMSCQG